MQIILDILKALIAAVPALAKLVDSFKKTPQQKVEEDVEDLRDELDEFKKTGRPKR